MIKIIQILIPPNSRELKIIEPLDSVYLFGVQGIEFVEGVKMKEVARVLPSKMRDFILIKALPKSETGVVI